MEPRLRGAKRNPESVGHVLHFQVGEEAERKDRPVRGVETAQGGEQGKAFCRVRRRFEPGEVQGELQVHLSDEMPPSSAFHGASDEQAPEPGRPTVRIAQRVDPSPRLDERILYRVLGLGGRSGDRQGEAIGRRSFHVDETREGFLVAAPGRHHRSRRNYRHSALAAVKPMSDPTQYEGGRGRFVPRFRLGLASLGAGGALALLLLLSCGRNESLDH